MTEQIPGATGTDETAACTASDDCQLEYSQHSNDCATKLPEIIIFILGRDTPSYLLSWVRLFFLCAA